MPVAGIIVAGCAAAIVAGWRRTRDKDRPKWERDEGRLIVGVAGVVGAVAIAITVLSMFPYDRAYHEWAPAAGTVATVDTRILDEDGGTTYDVRFAGAADGGVGSDYVCADTRCATIRPGDRVVLSCKLWYARTAADWWQCRYVKEF